MFIYEFKLLLVFILVGIVYSFLVFAFNFADSPLWAKANIVLAAIPIPATAAIAPAALGFFFA